MLKKNRFLRLFLISFAITFAITAISTISIYAYTTSKSAVTKDVKAAQKAIEANDLKKAESLFKSALDKDKYSAAARIGLADLYLKMEKPEDAIKLLKDGITLVPGNYEYYIALIKTYVKLDRTEEAYNFINSVSNSAVKKKLAEKQPDEIKADPQPPQTADKPLHVTLTSSKGTTIYYTINGSVPTLNSAKYSKAIEITANITLKAFAIDENGVISNLFSGVYNVFNGTKEYKFSDKKIETIVRTRLNRPTGAIYLNDLVAITTLANTDNSGKPIPGYIVLLDDLSAFTGLTDLSLEDEQSISDLTPLSKLENLRRLTLNGCNIDDNKLAKLGSLKNLNYLSLERNNISNLSNLKPLVQLHTLSVSNNRLSDISPVSSLTALETLNISKNGIENLSSLQSLAALKELNASENAISDLSQIANMKALRILNVSSNRIFNLNGIQNIKTLEILNASQNSLSDLSTLNGNTSITELNLSGNSAINNLSPLTTSKVSKLTATNCNINTLENIARIPDLNYLNVSNNNIYDLSPLINAANLATLNIQNNSVSSLTELRSCPALKTVYCSGNLLPSGNTGLEGTGIQVYRDK